MYNERNVQGRSMGRKENVKKILNLKKRVLLFFIAIGILVNSIPVYALENTDSEQDNIVQEILQEDVTIGEVVKTEDDIKTEEEAGGDEVSAEEVESTLTVSNNTPDETDVEDASSENPENNSEEKNIKQTTGKWQVKIEETTNNTIRGVIEVTEFPDNKEAYFYLKNSSDRETTVWVQSIYIEEGKSLYEFEYQELYADTEYRLEVELRENWNTVLESSGILTARTKENLMDFKIDIKASDITQTSAIISVAFQEETIRYFREKGYRYQSFSVNCSIKGENSITRYSELWDNNNFATEVSVDGLIPGVEYTVVLSFNAGSDWGKFAKEITINTEPSGITYTFEVEDKTLGNGFVNFSLNDGYEEGKEYDLRIYVAKGDGKKQWYDSITLNKENNYNARSTIYIFDKMECNYIISCELIDRSVSERVLLVPEKSIYIKYEKIFNLLVHESSLTYTTGKLEVEWMNTEAIQEDEVQIHIYEENYKLSEYLTLNKNQQTKVVVPFYRLKAGKESKIILEVKINGIWYEMENIVFSTKAVEFEKFIDVKFPSQLEIARRWKELDISDSQEETYDEKINHTNGGILSKKTLQNALNLTNFIRYVAGLPDDVIYDEEWCRICNSGSEINRLNNKLDHHPEKPEGVSEDFYNRGYVGTSNSNLAMGYSTLALAIKGFMADHGEGNIEKGHRNWILKPYLGVTGFGKSSRYYSMYVTEGQITRGTREVEFSKGYYYWPAHNMPMELYTTSDKDYNPSLYLASEYDTMNAEDITLHVKSKKLGKEWTLKGNQGTYASHNYMRVYGNYLVFDTGLYPKGDEVTVTVTGTKINGVDAPIKYTMNFFSISDINVNDIPVESIAISSEALELCEGENIQLNATVLPSNATNKQISWSVESEDGKGKAVITQDGILTGTLEGEVRVTATSKENKHISDSLVLKIKEKNIPLESISFAKENIRMEKGNTHCLTVNLIPKDTTQNHVTYESSDETKVSVKDGIITALEVTKEPVIIRASVGNIYAETKVEVYEISEEEMDKYYSTRITQILISGENSLLVGEETILKIYPVTNGYELTKEEYEVDIVCNEKNIAIESLKSEDEGCWYKIKGNNIGNEKMTVTLITKFPGIDKQEKATKSITVKVIKQVEETEDDISNIPVVVSKNLTVNQNLEKGVKIDIRLKEGNEAIENIYLTSKKQDGSEKAFVIQEENGNYYIHTKEVIKNKKYNLILHIKNGLGEWEYPINVTTKQSFPKITVKQSQKPNQNLLYENAIFKITADSNISQVDFVTSSVDFVKEDISGNGKEYQLTLKQQEHGKKIDKQGKIMILFEGYRISMEKKIKIVTVNKSVKPNTLVPGDAKIILNTTSETALSANINIGLKNSDKRYPDKLYVQGADKKSKEILSNQELVFFYNKDSGKLHVMAKEGIKIGNYKFTYTGMLIKDDNYISAYGAGKVTIQISQTSPSVTLKASGSIDLINRTQSCITYTPVVKVISGKTVAVELTGKNAINFYSRVTDDGKIKLFVREFAKVIPKQTYEIGMKITLNNGYELPESYVKVKPKQSSFKAAAKETQIALCKKETKAYPLEFVVKSPKTAEISYVKAISVPEGFAYDSVNRTIKISNTKKVKTNKTYSISFEVTPKGAYRSVAPSRVTVKIKVQN